MIVRIGINLDDGTRLEPGDEFPGTPAAWLLDQGIVADVPAPTDGARALASELNIDLDDVEGSGKDGRVTKDDVEKFAADGGDEEE